MHPIIVAAAVAFVLYACVAGMIQDYRNESK